MIGKRWFAALAGTAILAVGFWFGFWAFTSDRTVGLTVVAVALVAAIYGSLAIAGGEGIGDAAFRASLIALAVGLALLLAYQATDSDAFLAASPIAAAGFGLAESFPPSSPPGRVWIRRGVVVGFATAATWIYGVDHTVFWLVSPFLPILSILLSDKLYDRGTDIVAETTQD